MSDEHPNAPVQRTFDAVSGGYDQVIGFFAPLGRYLVAAAEVRPGQKVLDIASGRGACLYPALDAVGATGSVLGIDLAPGMVEALSIELQSAGHLNAQIRQGDAEELDLPDGWFDVVTGGFMIFFPKRPERVLQEVHRVLKPGGRVALSIFDGPAGFAFQDDLVAAMGIERSGGPSTSLNKATVLDEALVAAGFDPPAAVDVVERYTFADVTQVEAWQRTTGMRTVLDQLDASGRIDRYRERLAAELEAHRVDGGFELVQRARMTVARRP